MLSYFWSENFWLPANVTWEDVTNDPSKDIVYAQAQDLWIQLPMTMFMLLLRYLIEKFCFAHLGRRLNIKNTKGRKRPQCLVLETAYKKSPKIKDPHALAKQADLTERQVERWWRFRRSEDKPSRIAKFCEHLWRGSYYLCISVFGLYVLWDKEWLWDVDQFYPGYPHQGITADLKLYYAISTSFYCSITITQFWDAQRKDFWIMFFHHIITVILLTFSWMGNVHRMGSLILFLHDISDIALDLGKATKFAGCRGEFTLYAIFTVVWILTRIIVFPFFVLRKATERMTTTPMIFMLIVLLWILTGLHVIWTWMLLKGAYKSVTDKVADVRSSTDEE